MHFVKTRDNSNVCCKWKFMSAVKCYQTVYEFKCGFKSHKPRKPHLVTQGDHRKAIKVMKVLNTKCAPVTGNAKGIVMACTSSPDMDTNTDLKSCS